MVKQNESSKLEIVILGGGTAGWMTAAALAKLSPDQHYQITLVESEAIGTVGVGEATLPSIRAFNQTLGIDETEFIIQTKATFKLGIEFSNWGQVGTQYIHPFGDFGEPIDQIASYHYWLKHRKFGGDTKLDNYSVANQLCLANKFSFPTPAADSPAGDYSYAYHTDAGLYANYLAEFAQARGVTRVEGKVTDVLLSSNSGNITTLLLDDGQRISADFFVDCSGFSGRLIKQALQVGFEDWSQWLPCNRAIAIASEAADENTTVSPYTQAFAHDSGWQWRIPLQHRVGNGIVYCDRYKSEQHALADLLQSLTGPAISEPKYFSFTTGKLDNQWYKNCVAIGLSSGFLEPLESTSIHLIQVAIMQLIDLLPSQSNEPVKAQQFNRFMDNELLRIRDFLILHYYLNERDDSQFWRDCQSMSLPESLEHKLALFNESGQLAGYQHGLFLEPSWLAVLLGQGRFPKNYDPRLANVSPLAVEQLLKQRRHAIANFVAECRNHSDVLAQLHCSPPMTKRRSNGSA